MQPILLDRQGFCSVVLQLALTFYPVWRWIPDVYLSCRPSCRKVWKAWCNHPCKLVWIVESFPTGIKYIDDSNSWFGMHTYEELLFVQIANCNIVQKRTEILQMRFVLNSVLNSAMNSCSYYCTKYDERRWKVTFSFFEHTKILRIFDNEVSKKQEKRGVSDFFPRFC